MKKGLINIIILILLITNIVLSAIIVFAVVPAMNGTTNLVKKVAEAIDLEKEGKEDSRGNLTIDDIDTFAFSDKILVNLKTGEDGKSHYASFNLTITLNKSDESYEKYAETLKNSEDLMKSKIDNIVSKYTKYEVENNKQAILDEIVAELRTLFNDTTFIYSAGFSDFVTQ